MKQEESAQPTSNNSKVPRLPGIPYYWENFLVSILFLLLLPLLPIGIEYIKDNTINPASLVLAASMYTVSVGVSSKSRLLFGLTVCSSIMYAALYGIVTSTTEDYLAFINSISTWGIICTFVLHVGERFNRHVADRNPFWDFMKD